MARCAAPKRPAAPRVAIRGRGRAGKALARSLAGAGVRVAWIRRTARPAAFDVLVLAVPDDAITRESARLLRSGASARCAMHLSGALPAEILRGWRKTGAGVVSSIPSARSPERPEKRRPAPTSRSRGIPPP